MNPQTATTMQRAKAPPRVKESTADDIFNQIQQALQQKEESQKNKIVFSEQGRRARPVKKTPVSAIL